MKLLKYISAASPYPRSCASWVLCLEVLLQSYTDLKIIIFAYMQTTNVWSL